MKDVRQKPTVRYRLLHKYSNKFIFHWFSGVEINGKENIPQDSPCIILPCHQNGLIDCITLLVIFNKPITFFAKSSLFVSTIVSNFLIFLRIMPAYRQRDGLQNVAKNEDNFFKAVDLLLYGLPLCIMPEGGQDEKHHLRAFAKGPFRIAFYTQEKLSDNESIYLVPIGLDYGNYDKMGYPFVLNIAKPIEVRSYMQAYKENAAKAINSLKDTAYQLLSENMLDIRSEDYYEVIYTASYLYNFSMLKKLNLEDNYTNRLKARQVIAKQLDNVATQMPSKLQLLSEKCNLWMKKTPDLVSMSNNYPKKNFFSVLSYLIFLFPIFAYGFLLNVLAIVLIWILNPKFKKSGFTATMKYAIFLLFSPINHLLFSILIAIITSSWIISVIVFLSGLPLGIFCKKYIEKCRTLKSKLLLLKHKKDISDICAEIEILIND